MAILTHQIDMIDTPVLRHLARAGKLDELVAKAVPGGFVLVVRNGLEEEILRAQRGGARTFKRLDAVSSYLAELGVTRFCVDLSMRDGSGQAAFNV